jgi:hypothetical protein
MSMIDSEPPGCPLPAASIMRMMSMRICFVRDFKSVGAVVAVGMDRFY